MAADVSGAARDQDGLLHALITQGCDARIQRGMCAGARMSPQMYFGESNMKRLTLASMSWGGAAEFPA